MKLFRSFYGCCIWLLMLLPAARGNSQQAGLNFLLCAKSGASLYDTAGRGVVRHVQEANFTTCTVTITGFTNGSINLFDVTNDTASAICQLGFPSVAINDDMYCVSGSNATAAVEIMPRSGEIVIVVASTESSFTFNYFPIGPPLGKPTSMLPT